MIRTSDLCLRRAALYPAELRVQQRQSPTYSGWRGSKAIAGFLRPLAGAPAATLSPVNPRATPTRERLPVAAVTTVSQLEIDMATFRRRGNRWQVQVRRTGLPAFTRSFTLKRDAEAWARATEAQLERGECRGPQRPDMRGPTLAELVIRYRDGVSCHKKGRVVEWIRLSAFLRHPLCQRPAIHVSGGDFAAYRDERLLSVGSGTVRRELSILHNMFEVAMREWGLRRADNPVALVRRCPDGPHRERRLRPGEAVVLYAA